MPFNIEDWHERFQRQALWTQQLRHYLLERANISTARSILEVGCGTGVILADIRNSFNLNPKKRLVGLDINAGFLDAAMRNFPEPLFVQGDAFSLPFQSKVFNLTICHFLLLWLKNPLKAIQEMRRVTRSGGAILALAEPDYGGRIDFPTHLSPLGVLQQTALRHQGAEPQVGRQLSSLFSRAGLNSVMTGVIGGQWSGPPSSNEWRSEWTMIEMDLKDYLSPEELVSLKKQDADAWEKGDRTLFVPTFYAWGRVA